MQMVAWVDAVRQHKDRDLLGDKGGTIPSDEDE
jgi:hypothetical protein